METLQLPESKLTKRQTRTVWSQVYEDSGRKYQTKISLRFDDECGNGHNTFAITADVYLCDVSGNRVRYESGGCCHEDIAKGAPELAQYIKWHLCSTDGPMHYVANTSYHASNRDCYGLLKGERRQIVNGRTKLPAWILESTAELPKYVDAKDRPTETATLRYVAWERIGEGKERNLDAARRIAIWPEATDDDLTAPGLEERLLARLPKLLEDFKAAMLSLGFEY